MKLVLVLALLFTITQGVFVSNESTYPSLPDEEGSFKSRICIFIDSETFNDDMGTIYLNLAETLDSAGHEVTILVNERINNLETMYLSSSISVDVVPKLDIASDFTPAQTWQAYEIYTYLKTQNFDVVHFADWKGNAYFSVLAKHQGLAFDHTVFVLGAQMPYVWSKVNNFERVKDTAPLEIDFMQRMSIQYADVVVSPSQFMLNWLVENGWELPEQSYVEQNIVVNSRLPRSDAEEKDEIVDVNEIVYFGDLSPSEGLVLFCDALDKLATYELPEDMLVTFLGKTKDVQGLDAIEYIKIRSRRWTFKFSVIDNKDRFDALSYLSVGSRLAVVAPEKANSPLRIEEMLWRNIPFLASNVGGISELVDEISVIEVLFNPRYDKLADRIAKALTNGVRVAKFAQCPIMTQTAWTNFHSSLRIENEIEIPEPLPLVSVCITHFNRPVMLRQAIASIERQTYSNIEVVLVDDASTDETAIQQLNDLKPIFAARGWKIIVNEENSYLGKSRNVAVQNANGQYILFLDDDNVAKPNEVATFVTAAQHSGADLLTSVQDFFSGEEAPTESTVPTQRRVPLGGDVATGFFWNCFGDANSFVRRSSFLAIGGFTEDFQVGYEDYEFFAKAVLKGYSLEVVPEALFWYRRAYDTMSYSTPLYKNRMRYLRPYVENMSPSMSNLFLYVQSMHYAPENPFMGPGSTNCSAFTECKECKNSLVCGWCPLDRTCKSGNATESSDGTCTVADGWSFSNKTACIDCSNANDNGNCTACADKASCGYCHADNNCYIAAKNGTAIYQKSPCHTTDTLTTDVDECSSKSSSKKKLIIIVVCTVGGALLLIAAVALIGFFLYTKNANKGYTPINQG